MVMMVWGVGRPSKLSDHQKDELKNLLHQKDNWTTIVLNDTFRINLELSRVRYLSEKYR